MSDRPAQPGARGRLARWSAAAALVLCLAATSLAAQPGAPPLAERLAAAGTPRLVAAWEAADYPGEAPGPDTTHVRASLAAEWEFALEEDLQRALGTDDPARLASEPWPAATTRRLPVPGCFTAQERAWWSFVGAGWYRVVVDPGKADVPAADLTERALRFEGVAREAAVFVDGRPVRAHRFSWVPFEALLGPEARSPFALAVRVENSIPERGIPDAEWNGWWNHAGIFRDVALVARRDHLATRAPTFRSHLRDADDPAQGWTVLVFLPRHPGRGLFDDEFGLEVTLRERGGAGRTWRARARLGPGRTGVTLPLPGDVAAWSPESPALHEMEWVLTAPDESGTPRVRGRGREAVGLRDLRVVGPRVLLNGRQLRLFGLCYHEVYHDSGFTATRERLRADLLDMKALGANFIRVAHYPGHPALVELADEIGLAVWQEIPAWKTSVESLADDAVVGEWAEPYLRAMVTRDLNRPSVFFWSVGNEFDTTDPRTCGYVRRTIEFVRSLDPTRLVSYASDRRLDDVCLGLADVIGINEYYGWYYGQPADLGPVLDELIARHRDRPILVTEYGAGCIAGLARKPEGSRRDYSEPRQADFLAEHTRQILDPARAGHVVGATWWLYRDFDDPHRTERHKPVEWHRVNLKGLRTRDDATKASYERFRELAREFGFLRAGEDLVPTGAGGATPRDGAPTP